jgi:hypothetical protein
MAEIKSPTDSPTATGRSTGSSGADTQTDPAGLSVPLFSRRVEQTPNGASTAPTVDRSEEQRLLARTSPATSSASGTPLRNRTELTYQQAIEAQVRLKNLTRTTGDNVIRDVQSGNITAEQAKTIAEQASQIRDAKWMEQRYEEGGAKLLLACTSKETYEKLKASGELRDLLTDKAQASVRRFQQRFTDELVESERLSQDIARALATQARLSDRRGKSGEGEAPSNTLNGALVQLSQDYQRIEKRHREADPTGDTSGTTPGFMSSAATEAVIRRNEASLQALGIDRPQSQLVGKDSLQAEIDQRMNGPKKDIS